MLDKRGEQRQRALSPDPFWPIQLSETLTFNHSRRETLIGRDCHVVKYSSYVFLQPVIVVLTKPSLCIFFVFYEIIKHTNLARICKMMRERRSALGLKSQLANKIYPSIIFHRQDIDLYKIYNAFFKV